MLTKQIMLSATLFGSIYMFGVSLHSMNQFWIKKDTIHYHVLIPFFILNGTIFTGSGIMLVLCGIKGYGLIQQ